MGQNLNHQDIIQYRLDAIEECKKDHEARLRILTGQVANGKSKSTLQLVSSFIAVVLGVLAIIKAFFG